jgi:serine/threonine protein kinase
MWSGWAHRDVEQAARGRQELLIFQEWVAGGSLSAVLAQFGGRFELGLVRRYLVQLIAGLTYLHAQVRPAYFRNPRERICMRVTEIYLRFGYSDQHAIV